MIGRATYPAFSSVTRLMQNATNQLLERQQDAAGLDRLRRPSEHPADAAAALRLDAELDQHYGMNERLTRVTAEIATAEGMLGEAGSLLIAAHEIGLMMASETRSLEERQSAAEQIGATIESLVHLANSEVDGVYLFSGTAVDTLPFDDTGAYQGSSAARSVPLLGSETIQVGMTGDRVFGAAGSGAFAALTQLQLALEDGTDTDAIVAANTAVSGSHDELVSIRASYGVAEARIQDLTAASEDAALGLEGFVGSLREMDMIEAFTELAEAQNVYQSAATTMGRMLETNIFQYL